MSPAALSVLLYSTDAGFSDLVKRNLARRGLRVRQEAWAACHGGPGDVAPRVPQGMDVVIADLDCTGSACWQGVVRLRRCLGRSLPVVVLAYEWPDAARLGRCEPCGYLRKPFAVDELLRVLQEFQPAAA